MEFLEQKCCGSAGFLKHDDDYDEFRASKIAKIRDDLSLASSKAASSYVNFSDDGQHHHQQQHNMLSFSSPKLEDFSTKCGGLESKNLQKSGFPSYFQHPNSSYSKISGYSYTGGVNASMYMVNGVKGPFTPAQWIELEQQALIYKYIVANETIPPNLLIPIRRSAHESPGFISFPAGFFRPNSFGWGPFHLGFSNSTDPEPGRCRRTDGKKWRCSREAVPDQKYCERHINRGRHRSRKPVEGHSGSGSTPTTKLTNSTQNPVNVAASSTAALVVPGASAANTFASDPPTSSLVNRLLMNKQNSSQGIQDATGLDFLSSSISLKPSASTFSTVKNHIPFTESSTSIAFGLLTSDPQYRTYASSQDLNAPQPEARPFMDDFMSSTSSPTGERVTLSPLRLSGELDMGLGVATQKQQSTWVPISWETSVGGPLGEALKTTSNSSESQSKHVCSPRGVLQRTPLGSVSSSAGSSPRAENGRALESGSLAI